VRNNCNNVVVWLFLFWFTILLFWITQSAKHAGSVLRHKVQFTWSNQEDNAEVCMSSPEFRELAAVLLLQTSYVNSTLFFNLRRRPFQMPGTRCCPCCIWWPWSACCRPTPCFSPGHTAMAMPQEFLKVLQLLVLTVNPKCCRLGRLLFQVSCIEICQWFVVHWSTSVYTL